MGASQLAENRGPEESWYATDGVTVLGPSSIEWIVQAASQGLISRAAYIRHERWLAWSSLLDWEALEPEARQRLRGRLEQASHAVGSLALEGPAPESGIDLRWSSDRASGTRPRGSIRPPAVDPVGVMRRARDLREAMLLAVSTAASASASQFASYYHVDADSTEIVACAVYGSAAAGLLGYRLASEDPSCRAALMGAMIATGAAMGPEAEAIARRSALDEGAVGGVAMLPVVLDGCLVGLLELARLWRPYRARELSRVEDVLDLFVERGVVMGWLS